MVGVNSLSKKKKSQLNERNDIIHFCHFLGGILSVAINIHVK
jgi:hypothetical protein